MKSKIFSDLDGSDLMAALDANASKVETILVERTLTPQQVTDYAMRQQQIAERLTEIEDQISEFVKPLKEEAKDIIEQRKVCARITKKGYMETEEKVYWIQDFENKMMLAYDGAGELVKSRKMSREERQLTLIASENNKKASNS